MSFIFNPFTGNFDAVGTSGGGGGSPGGSNTQVQFNDGGSFGGDAGFTFDKLPGGTFSLNTPAGSTETEGGAVVVQTGSGGTTSGSGGSINFESGSAQGGQGGVQNLTINDGGTGYVVGDILYLVNTVSTKAVVEVTEVDGGGAGPGVITDINLISAGTGYSTGLSNTWNGNGIVVGTGGVITASGSNDMLFYGSAASIITNNGVAYTHLAHSWNPTVETYDRTMSVWLSDGQPDGDSTPPGCGFNMNSSINPLNPPTWLGATLIAWIVIPANTTRSDACTIIDKRTFGTSLGSGAIIDITTLAGFGDTGGDINFTTGNGSLSGGNGGSINFSAGNAQSNGDGGSVNLTPGTGTGTGVNGLVKVFDQSGLAAMLNTSNLATVDRTFAFPDKSGTFALLSDITGGGTTKGIAEVDFGVVSQESDIATVTVSDAAITATSYPSATLYALATTDHDPDDYMAEGLTAFISSVTAGAGFNISVRAPNLSWGKYKVTYMY